MSDSFQELQDMDPHTTLSNEDLLRLLMSNCSSLVRTEIKLERQFTKELTNDKIDIVVQSFMEGIRTLTEAFNDQIAKQSKKIADLELKLDTGSNYLENLLYNVRSDIAALKCSLCEKTFQTQAELHHM